MVLALSQLLLISIMDESAPKTDKINLYYRYRYVVIITFFIRYSCWRPDINTNCFKKNALKVHFKFTMVYAEIKSKLL